MEIWQNYKNRRLGRGAGGRKNIYWKIENICLSSPRKMRKEKRQTKEDQADRAMLGKKGLLFTTTLLLSASYLLTLMKDRLMHGLLFSGGVGVGGVEGQAWSSKQHMKGRKNLSVYMPVCLQHVPLLCGDRQAGMEGRQEVYVPPALPLMRSCYILLPPERRRKEKILSLPLLHYLNSSLLWKERKILYYTI